MSVTVMFIVLFNVVYSLDGMSVNVDSEVKKSDGIVVKIPISLTDGTIMVIRGKFNSTVDLLEMTIFGETLEKDEECRITYEPSEGLLKTVSKSSNASSSYQLNKNKGTVPFEFRMTARAEGDVDMDLIHVTFEGNKAGRHALDSPCTFTSLKNVDKILFNGAKHIRNLTFTYPEIKEDR